MKTNIQGKNLAVNDRTRAYFTEKLSRFDKFFRSEVVSEVKLYQERNEYVVEITIPLKNNAFLRAEGREFDLQTAIDLCFDRLERQIRKHKTALKNRYVTTESIRYQGAYDEIDDSVDEDTSHEIVKTKSFPVKPMDPEEAVMQMKLLGHAFFMFRNAITEEINVVYARKNGGFGLIEPEV